MDIELSQNPNLAVIKNKSGDGGELIVIALLNILIEDCTRFFQVGKIMGPEQITETSRLIAQEFYFLKPDDFKLCFSNAKMGMYGKVYDRVDGQIICEWLYAYCDERANYFQGKHNKKIDPEVIAGAAKIYSEARKELEADVELEKQKEDQYRQYKIERMKQEINNTNEDAKTI